MTKEQKEVLAAWRDNLLVTYRLDFFRGRALHEIVRAIKHRCRGNFGAAFRACIEAKHLGFAPDQKDYTDLLQELLQIEEKVPLSDSAHRAIAHVFGGDWKEAMEAIDNLKSERSEQN